MPRKINMASQEYPPGTRQFNLNAFRSANTSKIVGRLTRESWPGTPADTVARITVAWDVGGGGVFDLPGGVVLDRNGQPLVASVIEVDIPELADGQGNSIKRNVTGGTITIELFQALTTAVTLEAV